MDLAARWGAEYQDGDGESESNGDSALIEQRFRLSVATSVETRVEPAAG
ncbi:MAG: hypothetical protein U0821_10900 [Chloroflexota bacterium]